MTTEHKNDLKIKVKEDEDDDDDDDEVKMLCTKAFDILFYLFILARFR